MQKSSPIKYFWTALLGFLVFVQTFLLVVSQLNLKFSLRTAFLEPYVRYFFKDGHVHFSSATWSFPYKMTFHHVACVGAKNQGYVFTCEQMDAFWVPYRFWEFKVKCTRGKVQLPQAYLGEAFANIDVERALINVRPVSVCVEKARGYWGPIQWSADQFYYNKRPFSQLIAYVQTCSQTNILCDRARSKVVWGCTGGYVRISGKHVHCLAGDLNQLNFGGVRAGRLAFNLQYGQKHLEGQGYVRALEGTGFQVPELTFKCHRDALIAYASAIKCASISLPQVTLACHFRPQTPIVEVRSQAPFLSTLRLQDRTLVGDCEWQQDGLRALCTYIHRDVPLVLNRPLHLHFQMNAQRVIQYRLDVRNCAYGGAPWEEAHVEGQYEQGQLTAERIACRAPGTYVDGCAEYHLATGQYRFSLRGKLQPLSITSLTPDWWPKVWEGFKFSHWPYTDVDCLANVYDDKVQLFGVVACQNFYYKTLPIQRMKMQYTVGDTSTVLNVQGDLTGQLKWQYNPYLDNAYVLQYALDGTLPLAPMLKAMPGKWESFFRCVEGDAPTRCSLKGCTFGPKHVRAGGDTMNFSARTEEHFTVYDVPFRAANVSVCREGDNWRAQCNNVAVGETGLAFGTFSYKPSEPYVWPSGAPPSEGLSRYFREENVRLSPECAVDAHFCRVPLEALSAVPWVRDVLKNTDGKTTGFVDGELTLEGASHFGDMYGRCSLIVREANLGKLHVLGKLSSVLEKTFFGLGSFKFTAADAQLNLQRGVLCIPNVRVRGPIAKMEGAGWINLMTSTVDMGVDVKFLHDVKVPVMKQFFKILNPISHGFHAQLSGSVEEPSWDVSFNPLKGIFQ